ncbi:DUF4998 domain-containing protein [Fodinibius salsisoli]|uniref:DUF5013 domain-containing protein n=1 Tax=Fodinibius salsisoli TaxID=2820877 RepID=A0ABT3PJ48_9BACT|nr:DUF4998 domain-containing protein [Fodinibius salsisoli]MCW9705966.1 DUF5013 domain-containing protein [Fodinibius salsisoli]
MKRFYNKFQKMGGYIAAMALIICSVSCTSMNDPYQDFIEGGEIIYPAKSDSVMFAPGKNRVKLNWIVSDPAIATTKIYWRNKTDSVIVDVEAAKATSISDTLSVEINNIAEGVYTFQFINFDNDGNASVSTEVTGQVYGDAYQQTLLPRLVSSSSFNVMKNKLTVVWGPPSSSDLFDTQLNYMDDSGMEHAIIVPREQDSTVLKNYALGNGFNHSTYYVPDSLAIDTFSTNDVTTKAEQVQLANSGPDFEHGKWDGSRWGNIKDWEANTAVKTRTAQDGSLVGGFDNYNGPGHLGFERWSSSEMTITDGKVYQEITLPAGTYTFSAFFNDNDPGKALGLGTSPQAEVYLAAAKGNTLPNIADLESNALNHKFLEMPSTEIEFTLNQESDIAIGIVGTMEGTRQNVRISEVALRIIELQ